MKLRSYQRVGIHLIEKFQGRVLLADEQGLGKTLQVLEWLRRHPEKRPVTIVCPASVKYVWEDQARDHCKLRTLVCSGTRVPKKKNLLSQSSIFIINYDILLDWSRFLRSMKQQVVVFDEIHYIKNRGTLRTKAARLLCSPIRTVPRHTLRILDGEDIEEGVCVSFEDTDGKEVQGYISKLSEDTATIKTQTPHLIGLSGTPLTNRPKELWSSLNLIWPQHFPGFGPFAWEYCDPIYEYNRWSYNGASNLDKLHRVLKRTGMIRRRKEDVAKDLPKKQITVVPMDIDNRDEYNDVLNNFLNWLSRKDMTRANRASKAEKMTQISYLKQAAARGKMNNVKKWVDSFLEESDSKLVLGCIHHEIINNLEKQYKKLCVLFTGKTPPKNRRTAIREFCKNPQRRLFVGQIKAAGTGIDGLQEVSHTSAVVELPWDPGTLSQFFDRIHRIGQENNVNIYILVAKNTLEEKLCKIIQEKQDILAATLDGKKSLEDMRFNIYDQLEREILKGQ